jgi:hypothetical protein
MYYSLDMKGCERAKNLLNEITKVKEAVMAGYIIIERDLGS